MAGSDCEVERDAINQIEATTDIAELRLFVGKINNVLGRALQRINLLRGNQQGDEHEKKD